MSTATNTLIVCLSEAIIPKKIPKSQKTRKKKKKKKKKFENVAVWSTTKNKVCVNERRENSGILILDNKKTVLMLLIFLYLFFDLFNRCVRSQSRVP